MRLDRFISLLRESVEQVEVLVDPRKKTFVQVRVWTNPTKAQYQNLAKSMQAQGHSEEGAGNIRGLALRDMILIWDGYVCTHKQMRDTIGVPNGVEFYMDTHGDAWWGPEVKNDDYYLTQMPAIRRLR